MSGVRESNSIDLSSNESNLYEKPKKRWNYKKIGIITAGAVVAIIIIVVLAVVLTSDAGDETTTLAPIDSSSTTSSDTTDELTSPPDTTPPPTEITLEDFLNGELSTKRFNSKWVSGEEVLVNDEEGLKLFNVITGAYTTLLTKEEGDLLSKAFTYTLSPDNTHIILGYDQVKGFRHSFEASYSVVELNPDGSSSKATATPIKIYIENENDKLTLVQWSPNGQGLAIIYKNNIYYKPNLATDHFQVTTTGTAEIFNGIPDWVYEEEVFGSNSAMRFSPDGNKLAYIRFDDTQVDTFEYTYYGNPGDLEAQYPITRQITYPKVGKTNPTVQLFRYDLESKLEDEIPVPVELNNKEHIISTLSWANDDLVVATWMNREQNQAYIQICEPDLQTQIIPVTTPGGWVELFTTPLYNDEGSQFALIMSHDQGDDAGGYRHLTLLSTDDPTNIIVLTKGKYVVTQLIYWDTKENYIFYSANTEEDSRVSHIYAIKAENDAKSQCLTCDLDALGLGDEGDYKYFSASFAKDENRFGLNALGPDVPRADIYSYSVTEDGIVLVQEKEWETNNLLKQKIANLEKPFPTVEYNDEIVLTSGYKAQVSMILPGNIDKSGVKKYSVLINVYGGPDSYSVTFQWGTNWGTYLAAAKDIIYVRIDGRGSGLRGDNLMHEIYLKLGTVEIEDQIEVASALATKYPFIDSDRIAIWGWSYGGYAAGLALARDDKSVFKCAVSVAPVTDWTYYDTIYTERYMGLLANNEEGYNKSRLSILHEEFKGKNYFLIHGTLDDNVHFQQAMALSRTLETNAVLFKQMSYPDEDHSLSGVQPHLYNTLERYFTDCLQLDGQTTTRAPTTEEPTSPPDTTPLPTEITLDSFLSGTLSTRRFNSRWVSGVDVLVNDKEGLKRLNVLTGESAILLAKEEGDLLSKAFTYTLSPDNTHIILGYDQVKGFRHSFEASYSVVELNPDGSSSKATATPIKIYIENENDKLTLVQWSPNGQGLAIIYKNNIYYKPNLATGHFQVTKTGTAEIFNGIPDWVYEEEVFGSNSAMRFSPDGNKLAYIRFDDTQVDTFEYTYYGNPGDLEAQYPITRQITYPKVGKTNPTVQLFRYDLESKLDDEIPVPVELNNKEHIISTLSWANDDLVVATWMNREQNQAYIQICEPDLQTQVIPVTTPGGWVELFSTPLYNDEGSRFALIMSHEQGDDAGGYRHLTLLSTDDPTNIIVLTKGKYVVTQLIYWDTKENYIFYSANTEEDSRVSHIYAIKAESDAKSQCLTCDLDALGLGGEGDYKYFSASFAKDENRFGLNALGPDVPRADIYSYSVTEDGIVLVQEKEWETNNLLKQKIANFEKPFPTVEYNDEIVLTSGYKAQVSMILPGNIDKSGVKKYSVLINVYGGPDSYSVTFQWGTNWGTYLAAAKDIIYVRIDGRGSGLRGDNLMHEIYLKLGTVEIEDQIEVASALATKYPFIDSDRIAIWGWSYGGYAAGLALARDDKSVFKCAVSVAPVTDWTYYDTIYTERYMGLLANNEEGYNKSRLSILHEEFKGKNYFLIHGTLDDNVHFQQAMALSRTLETNAVLFKQMSYPDEDHSLSGVQRHLYNTLEHYFNDCLQLEH